MADKKGGAPTSTQPVTFTVNMTLDKETKNSLRFQEDKVEGVAPKVGTQYLQKHAIPTGTTRVSLTVTVLE